MKQKSNENFYSNPHYYMIKDRIEKGNTSSYKSGNTYKEHDHYFEKREKSFVLDCTNKLKMPQNYNGLHDKYLSNFLSKVSTLNTLKQSGVIRKHQVDGNNLLIFENSHLDMQRKRIINFPQNMKVELAKLKSRSVHQHKSSDKLPVIAQANQEGKEEQIPLSRRSSNGGTQDVLAQLKDENQEKNNSSNIDDKHRQFFKEMNSFDQGRKQKIGAVIKITSKQKLNDSKQNSPNRNTSQTTCETKPPQQKLHYDLFRYRNSSSHQIGGSQNQLNYSSSSSAHPKQTLTIRNQVSPNSHRQAYLDKMPANSIDPILRDKNNAGAVKNSPYLSQSNYNDLYQENSKVQSQRNSHDEDSQFLQKQVPKSRVDRQAHHSNTQRQKLKQYSTNHIVLISSDQNKTTLTKREFQEENKESNDNKKQGLSKEDFANMMKKYRLKVEENLKRSIEFQEQSEPQDTLSHRQDKAQQENKLVEEEKVINKEDNNKKINNQENIDQSPRQNENLHS